MTNDPKGALARGRLFKLLAVPLVVLSAVLGLGFAKWCRIAYYEPTKPPPPPATSLTLPKNLCRDWPKPDVVLVLSGQLHGYLLPCGCSHEQFGGLERRYNLLQILRDKGWDVVAADLGDLPQLKGPAGLPNTQGPLKYLYARRALDKMGYSASSFGTFEAALNLPNLLDLSINDPNPPVLAANLKNREKDFPGQVGDWELAKTRDGAPRVGIAAVSGPIVEEKITKKAPALKFDSAGDPLDKVLAQMADKKVDLRVLLYQGFAATPNRFPGKNGKLLDPEAIECAKAFPQFQVMICLDEAEEPPLRPLEVPHGEGQPKTLVARVGEKGKSVAVIGVYKPANAGGPFTFRYQNVELSEAFLTPKGEEKQQPILQLMEDYTKELKDHNYLAMFPQMKHPFEVAMADTKPEFLGSEACKKCHDGAYEKWRHSKHAKAYMTLVNATRPANRQYDAECIVCHTIGFGYKTGFTDDVKTKKLENVGCENCHGPCSEHVKDQHNAKWLALINPWRAQPNETPVQKATRVRRMDDMCQHCHDTDNDNTYTNKGFERKWFLIQHYNDDRDNWPPHKPEENK